ncbi:PREDICTED: NF-kappa-B essential modulator isoform X1 [Nicrophorus vespilloides]|uniref:NF-kappa-B essential modulator isoform X1 n=1 Tax=Nicrophorus vespilloides TaxID=110193 RepID=A0ABM1M0V6_NICVS|nr:PREDICTED: NF-kappa-B essential modulator isoform X1 [Nicrophorus vespilloides]
MHTNMDIGINHGLHQLPAACYPPSDSDEESFVVLQNSFSSEFDKKDELRWADEFSSEVIEDSQQQASDSLCTMTLQQSSEASAPISDVMSHDDVQRQVEQLIEENKNLKNTLEQNNIFMKTLKQWQEDVGRVQNSHKKKFAETKAYIEALVTENQRLRVGGDGANSDADLLRLEYSKNIGAQIEKNLGLENRIKELLDQNECLSSRIGEREQDFENKEQKYLQQITDLKADSHKAESEEIANLRKQLMEAQSCLTDIKQTKKAIQLEADANRKTIDDLQTRIQNMTKESDRTLALESQLDIFKNDFKVERESKQNIIREKNDMAIDMRNMQLKNEQLMRDIEVLRTKCTFVEVSHAPPSPPPTTYTCPLCMLKFRSIKSLEDHVELCLENTQ